MPLQEVMQKTTYTEYREWLVYLEMEARDFSTLNNMLAKICAEVRRSWVKDPGSVDVKSFLPSFGRVKQAPKKRKVDPEEKLRNSTAFWESVLGV